MRSFQTLATLVALMLFATKEAAALPQLPPPNVASSNIGAVGNQIGVASGNISPNAVNVPAYPFYPAYPGFPAFPGFPGFPVGDTATSQIGTVGNQIGVASGNINPGSTNFRRDLEDDLEARQYYPYYPGYYPGYYPAPPNTAVSTIGTAGNQIGVASGNINPTSNNFRRDLEDDLEARQYYPYYPGYYPGYYPAPPNTAVSTIGTAGNQIGVASGNINPTSTNFHRRDLEDELEARQYYPYYPGYYFPSFAGDSAFNSVGTVGNQIGVATGNISPTSTNV